MRVWLMYCPYATPITARLMVGVAAITIKIFVAFIFLHNITLL